MNSQTFRIPMRCATKQRARYSKHGTHHKDEYTTWKDQFGWEVRGHRFTKLTGKLSLVAEIYLVGYGPGDSDNYVGAIMDACNHILYDDDRQVKHQSATILDYADRDEVVFTVAPWTDPREQSNA